MSSIAAAFQEHLNDLQVAKRLLEDALSSTKRRVVVFVDDVDRLDAEETYQLLRLVRLCVDLPGLVFVLAFDRAVVARSIGSKFGGDAGDGVAFLEKLVQIPLDIPPAMPDTLRRFVFDQLESALDLAGIPHLHETESYLHEAFSAGIAPRLNTPREAVRYGNAVKFGLPKLAGEIDTIDYILFEALRVLYPPVYELVRKHPALFVGGFYDKMDATLSRSGRDKTLSLDTKGLTDEFENAVQSYSPLERNAARYLLQILFPAISAAVQAKSKNTTRVFRHPGEHQRISSLAYLPRAFAVSVPAHDVRDTEVRQLVDAYLLLGTTDAENRIRDLLSSTAQARAILEKLDRTVDGLDTLKCERLAEVLASVSDLFLPKGGGSYAQHGALSDLTRVVLRRIKSLNENSRLALLETCIKHAKPQLATGLLLAVRTIDDTRSSRRTGWFIEPDQEERLGLMVARAFVSMIGDSAVEYRLYVREVAVVRQYGNTEECQTWLKCFLASEQHQDAILRYFALQPPPNAYGDRWTEIEWAVDVGGMSDMLRIRFAANSLDQAVVDASDEDEVVSRAREFVARAIHSQELRRQSQPG